MMPAPCLAGRVLVVLSLLTLAGCGGGDGGGSGSGATTAATVPAGTGDNPTTLALSTACSGSACGAANSTTYQGSGVGIWRYDNSASSSAVAVPVQLTGVAGKTVTLVLTNVSDQAASLSGITLGSLPPSSSVQASVAKAEAEADTVAGASAGSGDADPLPRVNHIPDRIRHFVPPAIARTQASESVVPAPLAADVAGAAPAVGDVRRWTTQPDQADNCTLARRWAAPDGRMINLWVQTSELGNGKVTDAVLDQMRTKYASGPANSVYPLVVSLAGQPWGPYSGSGLIGPDQDMNIVVYNLTPDSKPYGLVGLFWSVNAYLNSYLQTADPADAGDSNEALALIVDSETLYLDGAAGQNTVFTTMAHEMTHMVEFYQRTVLAPSGTNFAFDTWLNEAVAVMMEDAVSSNLISGYNALRDDEFADWVAQSFNCDFIRGWTDTAPSSVTQQATSCFSYPIVESYGGYLLRQYGIDFYKNLLRDESSTDSFTVLDHAIKQAGGAGARASLRDWGAGLALLPAAPPAGFGFPLRSEQGLTMAAINGPDYAGVRRLPGSVPRTLQAAGHFPWVRRPTASSFGESVPVPAGSTLTVVVQ